MQINNEQDVDQLMKTYSSGPVFELLRDLKEMFRDRNAETDPGRCAEMEEDIGALIGLVPNLIARFEQAWMEPSDERQPHRLL